MVPLVTMLDALWKQVRRHPEDRGAHVALIDALLERGDPAGPLMLDAMRAGEGDASPALLELLAPELRLLAERVTQRWGVPREVRLGRCRARAGDRREEAFCSEAAWAGITRLELGSELDITPLPRRLLQRVVENAHELDQLLGLTLPELLAVSSVDRELDFVELRSDPDPGIVRALATPRLRIRCLSLPGLMCDSDEAALWWLLDSGQELLAHVEQLFLPLADAGCVSLVLGRRGPRLQRICSDDWSATRSDDGAHFLLAERTPGGSKAQRLPAPPLVAPPPRRRLETSLPPGCPFATPAYDDLLAHLARRGSEGWVDAFADGTWTVTVTGEGVLEPGRGPDALDLLPADFTLRYRCVAPEELPDHSFFVAPSPIPSCIERRFTSDERRTTFTIAAFGARETELQLVAFATERAYQRALPGEETPLRPVPELAARFPLPRLVELAHARGSTRRGRGPRIAQRRAERRARALRPPPCVEEELPF